MKPRPPYLLPLLIGCSTALPPVLAQADNPSSQVFDYTSAAIKGPFSRSVESLKQFTPPQWFADAKFGIWAHWGPQAVPAAGDWYARNMYIPGTRQYEHHLKHYGHPSETGFKDIIPLWKAEKFDPDALMQLYVKAGARYFVSMAVHHDNFDLWDSRYQRWNAVKMGPKRDIVGEWQKAAHKHKLPFGVSEHLGASFAWFTPSHGFDQFWPKIGVDYDGANPAFNDLYHTGTDTPYKNQSTWYTTNPQSQQHWFNRINDLVTRYKPDLLYTDGGIPFGDVGRQLLANFYNTSAAQHKGVNQAVFTHKDMGSGEFIREAGIQDVERGGMGAIDTRPWQTDTSIGDWFYSEGFTYKTTDQIVHTLADVVSKNGNLLLNVVLYADGSLPPEPRRFLSEMAAWMAINSEAIYATRPWKLYGEGPTQAEAGHFKESDLFTEEDIRFTTKANNLYAITLRAPSKPIRIQSLGKNSPLNPKPVKSIHMLGYKKALQWQQEDDALVVQIPAQLPSLYASSLKIEF